MTINSQHMTPKQLQNLIYYHAANSRFQNMQATMIKRNLLNTGGYSQEPDPYFQKLFDHHKNMADKHKNYAERLQKHLRSSEI
ncbi:MAG: hypothetical protein KGH75_03120 [Rhodospirillales bacterium]|nr:hypothetical protein [Rhodospirillales bacterium]